jgi:hypothetical protein
MDRVTVAVGAGGAVLLEGVPAYLRPAGPGALSGFLLAPADAPVEVDGRYQLRTDDGGRGTMLVTDRLYGDDELMMIVFTVMATPVE